MEPTAEPTALPPPARIAVFRALQLGDLLCASPALARLRRAFPLARLTLIGLPWAAAWAARQPFVDDFIAFPGFPGLPEIAPDLAGLAPFLAGVQSRRFDLAVQLHGSGALVNPLVAAFGATRCAVFHRPDDFVPDGAVAVPWPDHGRETDRLLVLVDAVARAFGGAVPVAGEARPTFPLHAADHGEAAALLAGSAAARRPYVCVHAGAQLPSRRWPLARFAAVARALHDAGWPVVLTGTAAEAAANAELRALMAAGLRAGPLDVVDLSGRTSLWQLGAVLERAALLVCNDTGVSHVAAALRVPSVVVSNGADVARWSPSDERLHRVLWADAPCRPCGFRTCPHAGHPCARDVPVATVYAAARAQLTATAGPLAGIGGRVRTSLPAARRPADSGV